jgi:hypothetical protein
MCHDCKKKNSSKKKSTMPWSCQIATRLVFAWCGCNLVKKRQVIATSKTCGCNIWCAAIAKKRQLQNQDVGDCLRPYSSVIATAAYVCFGKKRKKITEPVCDCNNSANVIATRSYVYCKMETWLCLFACKATWLFGIWFQTWVVSDCKKLKCPIAKSAGLFLWLQEKKKENWTNM